MHRASLLLAFVVVASTTGCGKKRTDAQVTITRDIPSASSSSTPDASPPSNTDAAITLTIPTVACDSSPDVRFTTDPASSFSCSPMRTSMVSPSTDTTSLDETGAKADAIDLTVSPGTVVTIAVGVKNAKGAAIPASTERFETKGFPPSAKVDATQTFQWKALGAPGAVISGSVATLTKVGGVEKCARQLVVIRIADDDTTRANQIAHKLRMEQLWRQIGCMFAHQGPDLAENGKADLQDELTLRQKIACGDPLVSVKMRDLDGDGLADAMVRFMTQPNQELATNPAAPKFQTGVSTQILLRRGDDFVRVAETPGEAHEADDGTAIFIDTNEIDSMPCPPRPYASTGGPFCGLSWLEIRRWTGKTVVKIGETRGDPLPGADAAEFGCHQEKLAIEKDAKGRVTGYRNGAKTISWKAIPAATE